MKTLKFRKHLVQPILDGTKAVTWRLFDDKNLTVGDQLTFLETESGEKFAEANIVNIREKKLGEVQEADFEGHEKYASRENILAQYKEYYGDKVTWEAPVKIIDFKVLRIY